MYKVYWSDSRGTQLLIYYSDLTLTIITMSSIYGNKAINDKLKYSTNKQKVQLHYI